MLDGDFHTWLTNRESLELSSGFVNVKDVDLVVAVHQDDTNHVDGGFWEYLIILKDRTELNANDDDLEKLENAGIKFEGNGIDGPGCVVLYDGSEYDEF